MSMDLETLLPTAGAVLPGFDDLLGLPSWFPVVGAHQERRDYVTNTWSVDATADHWGYTVKGAPHQFDRYEKGRSFALVVTTGTLELKKRDLLGLEVAQEKAAERRRAIMDAQALQEVQGEAGGEAPDWLKRVGPADDDWDSFERLAGLQLDIRRQLEELPQGGGGVILEFSKPSRRRMLKSFLGIDFTDFQTTDAAGQVVASLGMLTLTYPGRWQEVAPDGARHKRNMAAFWKAFERRWGVRVVKVDRKGQPVLRGGEVQYTRKFRGLWKMESQRRGAPHVHIFTAVPNDPKFREWLSTTWARIVGASKVCDVCGAEGIEHSSRAEGADHDCESEFSRHLRAGTGIDVQKHVVADNPKMIVSYFLKYATKSGEADKEYQHVVPKEWADGPGRFWGYKGLKVKSVSIELGLEDFCRLRPLVAAHYEEQSLLAQLKRAHARGEKKGKKKASGRMLLGIVDSHSKELKQLTAKSAIVGGWVTHSDPLKMAIAMTAWLGYSHRDGLPEATSGTWEKAQALPDEK